MKRNRHSSGGGAFGLRPAQEHPWHGADQRAAIIPGFTLVPLPHAVLLHSTGLFRVRGRANPTSTAEIAMMIHVAFSFVGLRKRSSVRSEVRSISEHLL